VGPPSRPRLGPRVSSRPPASRAAGLPAAEPLRSAALAAVPITAPTPACRCGGPPRAPPRRPCGSPRSRMAITGGPGASSSYRGHLWVRTIHNRPRCAPPSAMGLSCTQLRPRRSAWPALLRRAAGRRRPTRRSADPHAAPPTQYADEGSGVSDPPWSLLIA
jgi:hypothetical protein